jgi:hypothetical protein
VFYEIWDDAAGEKLSAALPEADAKAYALKHDPQGERLFLEDEHGDQLVWNHTLQRWDAA